MAVLGSKGLGLRLSGFEVPTKQVHPLGFSMQDDEGHRYTYVQFAGTVAAGDWVTLTAGYQVVSAASGAWCFGVSEFGGVSGEYGFITTIGAVVGAKVPATTAANIALGANAGATGVIAVIADTGGRAQTFRAQTMTAEASGKATVHLR